MALVGYDVPVGRFVIFRRVHRRWRRGGGVVGGGGAVPDGGIGDRMYCHGLSGGVL